MGKGCGILGTVLSEFESMQECVAVLDPTSLLMGRRCDAGTLGFEEGLSTGIWIWSAENVERIMTEYLFKSHAETS